MTDARFFDRICDELKRESSDLVYNALIQLAEVFKEASLKIVKHTELKQPGPRDLQVKTVENLYRTLQERGSHIDILKQLHVSKSEKARIAAAEVIALIVYPTWGGAAQKKSSLMRQRLFCLDSFKVHYAQIQKTQSYSGLELLKMNISSKDSSEELKTKILAAMWNLSENNREVQEQMLREAIPHMCYNEFIKKVKPLLRILAACIVWTGFDEYRDALIAQGILQRLCQTVKSIPVDRKNLPLLPLRTLVIRMITAIGLIDTKHQEVICEQMRIKSLWGHIIQFWKHQDIRASEIHQDHVSACLNLLSCVCHKNKGNIKLVVDKKAPRYLADLFKTTGLSYAIKWRVCSLMLALCSGEPNDTRQFVQKFLEHGGVKAMLTQLRTETNYRTMFAMFCALVDLTMIGSIVSHLARDRELWTQVLRYIYNACMKERLQQDCLDAVIDRVGQLISKTQAIGPTSHMHKALKSADTAGWLQHLILLNIDAHGKKAEYTLHVKCRSAQLLDNFVRNDPQLQQAVGSWIPIFLDHAAKIVPTAQNIGLGNLNFSDFFLSVVCFIRSACYTPHNKQNADMLNLHQPKVSIILTYLKRKQMAAVPNMVARVPSLQSNQLAAIQAEVPGLQRAYAPNRAMPTHTRRFNPAGYGIKPSFST